MKNTNHTGIYNKVTSTVSNASGMTSRIANTTVAIKINKNSTKLKKTKDVLENAISLFPSTNEDSEALIAINRSLKSNSFKVKALTGANTVREGKAILKEAKVIGKVGKYAGIVGTIITPFTEIDTSENMYKSDLALIKKYDPKDYNKAKKLATIGSWADASSFGFARSIAKTPTTIYELIPKVPKGWAKKYDATVNKYINAKSLNENVINPVKSFVKRKIK